jgi:hypothetical protein
LKRLLYISLLVIIFLFYKSVFSQPDTSKVVGDTTKLNQNRQEELLLENSLEDTEDSKLLDFLDNLKRNPFDLNTVSQQDLESVPFINSVTAKNIIEYRNKNISFKSKRELLSVEGVNERLYDVIKVYIVVKTSKIDYVEDESGKITKENKRGRLQLVKDLEIRYRTRFQQDLQTKEGYLSGQYPGTKAKIYNQINFFYDKAKYILESNLTIEKDPGETNLADFSSAYVELKNYKFIRDVVVGDYSLTFGQGLGMWSNLGFSKGSVAVDPVKKRGYGINSYSSVNESQFFRGAAADINYKYLDFILFYSNNFFDASIDTTLNEVSSFYFDGYHRTISEQNRKNSAREQLFGGRTVFNKDNLRLGLTYWTSKFSKQVGVDSTRQLYNFSGDKANMLSFDYDFIYRNTNLYGELARSQSGAVAGLSAFQISFSKIAELVFLYRYYPEDFSPVHSFGFGEKNGNTQNESGFYSGLSLLPMKGLEINAYYDQFKFPYRSYSDPAAISGNDFLTNVNWNVNKDLTLSLRYKNENKEDTKTVQDEFGRDVKKIDNRNQMNFRFAFDYDISDRLRVRSRYDYVFVKYDLFGGNNKGSLFLTDLRFVLMQGVTFSTRFISFDTEDYDSRIYEYEDDIRGVMSNLGLYGKGRRWYAMIKYRPFGFMEISGKYAETYMDGATSIGTGNDLIHNDINNKLNLGMEIFF